LLQAVLEEEGSLSGHVIDKRDNMPSSSMYRSRFGSLLRAYTMIGYLPDRDYRYVEINRTLRQSYPKLLAEVTAELQNAGGHLFCDPVSEIRFSVHAEPAFYVVLNSLTKNCTRMPHTDTPNITLASDTIFKTRAEAETAMKILKPCNQ